MSVPLRFRTAVEWRRWLRMHGRTESEALLLLSKKAATKPGFRYLEALEEALCFGWIDGKLRAHDAETFVLRFTPRRPGSVWSERNRARSEGLIRAGRMAAPGLAAIEAAKRGGAWAVATSPSRVPRMPSDLRNALRADAQAWTHFRAWGSSSRSACIRWVADAKTEATRRRRIERVVWRASRDERPSMESF